MRQLLIGLVLFFAVSVLVGAQGPSAPGTPASRQQDDQTISVDVSLVNVPFTVSDRRGKFVTNLRKEDFKIYEDNKLQTITNFSNENNQPLSIALLVDTSGSIRDKLKFEQEAAIEFFYSTLLRGKDKALIISFDSSVELLEDFTDNPETLAKKMREIRAGGGTALADAIYVASNQKLMGQDGRRVMIVISDGDDNNSRVSMTEALEAAQRNEVAIYTISTNSTANFGSKEQDRGDKTLRKLSDETGGKAFFPLKLQDLTVSFADIHDELRSQYQIAYRTSNAELDGSFRRIRIDVADKRYKTRAKTGYYMPKASPTSQR